MSKREYNTTLKTCLCPDRQVLSTEFCTQHRNNPDYSILAQAEQNLKQLGLKRIQTALYVLLQKSNEDKYLTLCSIFNKIFHT
jgi:hypothetical protein